MSIATMMRAALAAIVFAAGPASAKDWSTIRIGSEGARPPFNFLDGKGELQGFEIDLARAACARIKARCEFIATEWDSLIPGLLAGKFDAVFASLAITAPRRAVVAFTDRYYATPALFVARKESAGNAAAPAAMRGKVLGAQAGTTYADYLEKLYAPDGAQVKLFQTQGEAALALAAGRVDAILADKISLMTWLERSHDGDCCQVVGPDLSDPALVGAGVGAAVRQNDDDLRMLLDGALADIRADGTYARINARHFPYSLY